MQATRKIEVRVVLTKEDILAMAKKFYPESLDVAALTSRATMRVPGVPGAWVSITLSEDKSA